MNVLSVNSFQYVTQYLGCTINTYIEKILFGEFFLIKSTFYKLATYPLKICFVINDKSTISKSSKTSNFLNFM